MSDDQKNIENSKTKAKRPWWKRGIRIVSRSILVIILLFVVLVALIRSPWGQDWIVTKATNYVSNKTQTKVSIDKLFLTFSGDLELNGLYLEDQKQDTLLYSRELRVEIPIWPIIMGNPISIDGLKWDGLRANVTRKDTLEGYNFQFLIDAFASDSVTTVPEEESKPLDISIGSVALSNFTVDYDDEVTGMKAHLNLGTLEIEGKNLDLEKMQFEVSEILLENTQITYEQSKASPSSVPSESVMPYLSVGDLRIKNVQMDYVSKPDSMVANLDLGAFVLQVPKADLAQQEIEVNELAMSHSNIKLWLGANKQTQQQVEEQETSTAESLGFVWPDWTVKVNTIALENNNIEYKVGTSPSLESSFDPNHIALSDFHVRAEDISLSKEEKARMHLKRISFVERSGFDLKELSFLGTLDPSQFSLEDLTVKTGNSALNTDIKLGFASLDQLLNKPEEAEIVLDLKSFVVDLHDAFHFQPDLRKNTYLNTLAKHELTGDIQAKGKLTKVELSNFNVNWGRNTKIQTNGQFQNLLDFDQFYADIKDFRFQSNRSDLIQFVSEEDLGVALPKTVLVQSQFKGEMDDFKAIMELEIPEGKVKVDGSFAQQNDMVFDAQVKVVNFNLGKLLNNPNLGKVAFEMQADGKGNNINDLNAQLVSSFSQLELNGYDYSALKLDGKLHAGKGDVTLEYKDENLDLLMETLVELDSIAPKIALDFNMEGADFYALGLTEKQIRAKVLLEAEFKGNSDVFDLSLDVSEGIAVYDGGNHYLGAVQMSTQVLKDSIALDIKSSFLNGNLRANSGLDKSIAAVQGHLAHYFTENLDSIDSIQNPVKLMVNMKLSESDLITDFLLPEIKEMDTLLMKVDFDQKANDLMVKVQLPYIDYAGNTMDSLQINITSNTNNAVFKMGFNTLEAGPVQMTKTYLDGDYQNGLLNLHFHALDGEQELYVIKSEITGKDSDIKLHLNPEKLIINSKEWKIPLGNEIAYNGESIRATDFVLSRNFQSVAVANDLAQTAQNNLGIEFKNFKLSNILSLFNREDLLATGKLQGHVVAVDPLGQLGFLADFGIDSLMALETELGKLALDAKSLNSEEYNIGLSLKGNDIDFAVNGNYLAQKVDPQMDFKIALNKIGMKTIASLSGESLEEASGNISGEIAIQGSINEPKYNGLVQFNEAAFKVHQLNSKFYLTNDQIKIDNASITLKQFSIQDEQKNTFTLNGAILTESIFDPKFDLKINSKNFQALNSSEKDNEAFYGSFNFNVNGTILGKMSAPIVDVNVVINENTDFTYVLLNSQAQLEKSDGIVEFVNKEDPDNILTRKEDSAKVWEFAGMELHARIKVKRDAKFNIIIDPKTGDRLDVTGSGDLVFNIEKNGLTTMNGKYDIISGNYSLSLYNLVKREFALEKGSSIVWRGGGPLEAELNVTARYSVEASASALMASQISSSSDEVRNKYRQVLPFFVYMNFSGEIDRPVLNFNLGMPKEARGAIDGTVYGRIKQINNEQDALNKQVFSLLVLKKFYPDAGSDGSDGGAASIARKNINDALSDQLNAFSDKLLGSTGVELNVGLNSYTDYQGESAQQRTDLNITAQKKLFNDRLIVQVGSNVNVEGNANAEEETPAVGNLSVQYLLTEDGRWRVKGFRNSTYDNVIDGQIFVNGISLIFQRQFNKFRELKSAPSNQEEEE